MSLVHPLHTGRINSFSRGPPEAFKRLREALSLLNPLHIGRKNSFSRGLQESFKRLREALSLLNHLHIVDRCLYLRKALMLLCVCNTQLTYSSATQSLVPCVFIQALLELEQVLHRSAETGLASSGGRVSGCFGT